MALEIWLYNADNSGYLIVPKEAITTGLYARVVSKGGYDEGFLPLVGRKSDYPLSRRQRVEFIYRDSANTAHRFYRGYVRRIKDRRIVNGGKINRVVECRLFGAFQDVGGRVSRIRVAQSPGIDKGAIVYRIYGQAVLSKLKYPVSADCQFINDALATYDAYDKTVATDLDELTSDSGSVVYGCDVDSSGSDRLFFRPDDTLYSHTFVTPATSVSGWVDEDDTSKQFTVLTIKGGALQYPNLLGPYTGDNTSFERPFTAADTQTNLLLNPSFETKIGGFGNLPANWTLTGSSAWENSNPRTGNYKVRLGAVADVLSQKITPTGGSALVPGDTYVFSVPCRLGTGNPVGLSTATATITWYDTAGTTIVGVTSGTVAPAGASYDATVNNATGPTAIASQCPTATSFTGNITSGSNSVGSVSSVVGLSIGQVVVGTGIPVGTTITDIPSSTTLTLSANATATTPGLAITTTAAVQALLSVTFATRLSSTDLYLDDLAFYDSTALTQPGWELYPTGTASILSTNWAYSADAFDGVYCLYLKGLAQNADGNDIALRLKKNQRVGCKGNQSLRLECWMKSPPGETTSPAFQLQIRDYSNGTFLGSTVQNFAGGSALSTWTARSMTKTTGTTATEVEFAIVMRGNGAMLIDAVIVCENTAPADQFVEGSTYRESHYARILFSNGSAVYNEAIAAGDIEVVETQPAIINHTDGVTYATARLSNAVLPLARPTITTQGIMDTASGLTNLEVWPGQVCRAIGEESTNWLPTNLPVREIEYNWDGKLTQTIFLATDKEDPARKIRDIVLKYRGTNAPGTPVTGNASGILNAGAAVGSATNAAPAVVAANLINAGPASGGSTSASYRSLVTADIPAGILTGQKTGLVVTTTAGTTYTALATDDVVICSNSGAVTITLPTAAAYGKRMLTLKKSTTGNLIASRAASDTIDGATTQTNTTASNAGYLLASDGVSAWYIVSKF
jgi:hypothetical protein